MTAPAFILATDLDGTFLGGTEAERTALYRSLAGRDDALLIFVTGRDRDFVRELVESGVLPRPRYMIGDVGTSVFDGNSFEPIVELEREIAAAWGDSTPRVHALLADEAGLELQPTEFRYRVSYYYDPARIAPDVVERVERAGFDCLLSADRFLDVLPRGVAKGPTLLRLIDALGLDRERVLVAGDTLNDLSLFQTRLRGVAVGGSEPRLLEAIAGLSHVLRSTHVGAAGIAHALAHFEFHPQPKAE